MAKITDLRGREILIKVGAKDAGDGKPSDRRRGMLPPGKKKKGPTRRRAAGAVRIYDLGRRLVGDVWTDVPFSVALTIGGLPSELNITSLTLAQWQILVDEIKTVDLADWASTYYRIEYADGFRYNTIFFEGTWSGSPVQELLNQDNENWTEDGFTPHGGEAWGMRASTPLFSLFDTGSENKITAGPNYSDPPASIGTLQNGDKVFMMPAPVIIVGQSFNYQDPPGTSLNTEISVSRFTIRPREFWFNRTADGVDSMGAQSVVDTGTFNDYADYYNALAGVRMFDFDNSTNQYTEGFAGGFPSYPTVEPGFAAGLVDSTFLGIDFGDNVEVQPVAGSLLAVIQRGSTFYHVWCVTPRTIGEYGFNTISEDL